MPEEPEAKTNRSGCHVIAAFLIVAIIVLIAIGSGWVGQTDVKMGTPAPSANG